MKKITVIFMALFTASFLLSSIHVFAQTKGEEIAVEGKLICSNMEKDHKHSLKDSSGKVWNIIEKKPYEIGCQTDEVRVTGNKVKENEISLKSFEVKKKDGSLKKYTYCEAHKKMDVCSASEKK